MLRHAELDTAEGWRNREGKLNTIVWRLFGKLLLVVTGFFVLPTYAADVADAAAAANAANAAGTSDGPSVCPGQQAIPMSLGHTGLFAVRLTVNGTEGRYLVDSGANRSTLDMAEAKRNNAELIPYEGGPPGHGHAMLQLMAGTMALGNEDFGVTNLDFLNIPTKRYGGEPFAGQLGMSFFIRFKATIDFADSVMCITVPEAGA